MINMWTLSEDYHPDGFRWKVECAGTHEELSAVVFKVKNDRVVCRITYYPQEEWDECDDSTARFYFKRERDMMLFVIQYGEIITSTRYCDTRQKWEADLRKKEKERKAFMKKHCQGVADPLNDDTPFF